MEVDELKKEARIRNILNKTDELIMERISLFFPEKDEKEKKAIFSKATNTLKKLCIDIMYDSEDSLTKEQHGFSAILAAMGLFEMIFLSSHNMKRKDVAKILSLILKNFPE